jgi:outer membrane protein OmpA-like peptidoglycan-associated protein
MFRQTAVFPALLCAGLVLALGGCATNQPTLDRMDAMGQRLDDLEAKLKSNASAAQNGTGEAQKRAADLDRRIETLEGNLQSLKDETVHQAGQQQARIDQLGQAEAGLRQSATALSERLDQSERRLHDVVGQGQESARQNAGLEAALPPVQDQLAEQDKRLQELAPRLARVETGLQELGVQVRDTAAQTAGLKNDLPALHDRLTQSGGEMDGLSSRLALLEKRLAEAERTAREALELADSGQRAFSGKMLYSVTLTGDQTLFPLNAPELDQRDTALLDGLVERLKGLDNQYHLVIQGHTNPYGSDDYQYELGRARAEVVKRYLNEKRGISPARMSVISFGATEAALGNPQRNRRIVVQVMQ